jgi:hypothetical protein
MGLCGQSSHLSGAPYPVDSTATHCIILLPCCLSRPPASCGASLFHNNNSSRGACAVCMSGTGRHGSMGDSLLHVTVQCSWRQHVNRRSIHTRAAWEAPGLRAAVASGHQSPLDQAGHTRQNVEAVVQLSRLITQSCSGTEAAPCIETASHVSAIMVMHP